MLKLFLLFNLLLLNIYGCKTNYKSAIQKVKDSNSIQNDIILLPIKNHKRLVFTQDIASLGKNIKILKSDKFLSLYLVSGLKDFKYPFLINKIKYAPVAIIDKKCSTPYKVVQKQIGLDSFAKGVKSSNKVGLVLSSCSFLEAIATPKGVIEKSYIKRFLQTKQTIYGDVGIRVKQDAHHIVVSSSDPFSPANQLKKGDIILSLDGKKPLDASTFIKNILFSKISQQHTIKIKRLSKIKSFKIITQNRYGGGYISDTFLEKKGIYFDENLTIVDIKDFAKKYKLEVGDRLIRVNQVSIKNQQEVRENMIDFKHFASLLFQRGAFQFFVQIN